MPPVVREPSPVSRGQNVLFILPHDWASIAEFLAPLVERVDSASPDVQLVIATADAESAAAVIAASVRLIGDRPIRVLAATSAERAARLAKLGTPHVVAGTPTVLLAMLKASAIKLEGLRAIAIAWADELVVRDESASLEALMVEVPKDAPRTVVASVVTPAVDELVERYARRARREASHVPEGREPIALEYVLVASSARQTILRRLLDEIDPPTALVFAREKDSAADVTEQVRALGYGSEGAVKSGVAAGADTSLVVLYDLPASHEELREAVSGATRRIALIQPRQLDSLRALSLNGVLTPHRLPESVEASREREAAVLAQLRQLLDAGGAPRELLSLEPLLERYDGAEVAAAALRLLEQERLAHRSRAAQQERVAPNQRAPIADVGQPSPDRSAPADRSGPMVSLFVSAGTRDGATPRDIIGLLTSKAGIVGTDVGRIDVRESHSTVEVASRVADQVIERASGATVKGRRALIRRDEGGKRREARRDVRETGRSRDPRSSFRKHDRDDRPRAPRRDRGDSDAPRRGPRHPPRP